MDMPRTRLRALVLTVILLTTCAAALLYATAEVVRFYGTALRGVSYGPVPGLALPAGSLYGVNARLHEESPELAPRLLDLARQEGFGWLRQEFPWLRSRLPTLWTNSYFVATVGGAPLAILKQYIANQKNV